MLAGARPMWCGPEKFKTCLAGGGVGERATPKVRLTLPSSNRTCRFPASGSPENARLGHQSKILEVGVQADSFLRAEGPLAGPRRYSHHRQVSPRIHEAAISYFKSTWPAHSRYNTYDFLPSGPRIDLETGKHCGVSRQIRRLAL
jgi:hypothetical protein